MMASTRGMTNASANTSESIQIHRAEFTPPWLLNTCDVYWKSTSNDLTASWQITFCLHELTCTISNGFYIIHFLFQMSIISKDDISVGRETISMQSANQFVRISAKQLG